MIVRPTRIEGAFLVETEPREDERGSFRRAFCRREFRRHGLEPFVAQGSLSFTRRRGTLRGMHYQVEPHEETKLVRCVRGAIHDVVLDLRPASETYLRHDYAVLTAENRAALYVPRGCAHGFQTLEDDTEVLYLMSEFHAPGYARGVRWDDPAFGIDWPIADPILNDRDAGYPDFTAEAACRG